MNSDLIKEYILGNTIWANKNTEPVFDIHEYQDLEKTVKVYYSLSFRELNSGSTKLHPYMKNINCTISKDSITQFTRTKNLESLV